MSRTNSKPMKIVFISTQHVETDAMSFKSVVQRLTGKDSVVVESGGAQPGVTEMGGGGSGGGRGGMGLSRGGVSFKGLDGLLLMELPPSDELYWLSAD
ncbi:unnamed protein product [Camellia sinensis]|uniref:VQ motif-containing protein 1 n=1 Tax=Camellia lanceoleosa TaxID=1840588 RepID=A0ACC0HI25_9ERIC|nr:VQ motif-containing protein 1 [Camellia lanceoleosa]